MNVDCKKQDKFLMRIASTLFTGHRLSKPRQRTRKCPCSVTAEPGIGCDARSLRVPMRSRHSPRQTRFQLKFIFPACDCLTSARNRESQSRAVSFHTEFPECS